MDRLRKLLGIICVLGIVSFIICAEKGIKIGFENNHIVFNQTEKKSDFLPVDNTDIKEVQENVVYKNSDIVHIFIGFNNSKILRKSDGLDPEFKGEVLYKNFNRIRIYSGFENPVILRNSDGIDPEYLAKIEKEKAEKEARRQSQKYTGPNIVSLDDKDTISNMINPSTEDNVVINNSPDSESESSETNLEENPDITNQQNEENDIDNNVDNSESNVDKEDNSTEMVSGFIRFDENEGESSINSSIDQILENIEDDNNQASGGLEDAENENIQTIGEIDENIQDEEEVTLSTDSESDNIEETENIEVSDYVEEVEDTEVETPIIIKFMDFSEGIKNTRELTDYAKNISEEISRLIEESQTLEESSDTSDDSESRDGVLEEVQPIEYEPMGGISLNIRKAKKMEYEFSLNNSKIDEQPENGAEILLPESTLEKLISSEEIDFNSLESENDELLQEIFKKTHNIDVMNLVIKTYLSEYQFIKAKNFIESLDSEYLDNVNPLLNLQVAFNSFALTSKTISTNLVSLVEDYKLKNQISDEDRLRYLGVVSLMNQNYDEFFGMAENFTSDDHKNFVAKLQGYKEQIAKQMGMPDYYFDTLVSLELFNQGFFQPSKVLALYSLQQNPNYILPYQLLAYANFLTNSWDTSIEYMKKLIDLDPNNAEKYRFLMGVAYYRDQKYEQSVLMLSLIKNQKLRLDSDRYLIRDYIHLDQKNKLISVRNKLLGYENLVPSDFYTYFYEAFYHPFAEGLPYKIYAFDTELANKMIRLCSIKIPEEEKAVCSYGMIGKNIALGQFDGLEKSLLDLATQYPQGYLYQALGEYYIQQGDLEKGKVYLLKAVSMTKNTSEVIQIKKLLQNTM